MLKSLFLFLLFTFQFVRMIGQPTIQQLNDSSAIAYNNNDYNKSIWFSKKLITELTRYNDLEGVSRISRNIALAYIALNQLDSASKYLQKYYHYFTQNYSISSSSHAKAVLDKVRLLYQQQSFPEEIDLLKKQLQHLESVEDILQVALINELGKAYLRMHQLQNAEKTLFNALSICETSDTQKDDLYGDILNQLGFLYHEKGDFSTANEYYNLASFVIKRKYSKTSYDYAMIQLNQGTLSYDEGLFQTAISYLDSTKTTLELLEKTTDEAYLKTLTHLAMSYSAVGENEKAKHMYDEVVVNTNANSLEAAVLLTSLGSYYLNIGDHQQALIQFQHSKALFEELKLTHHSHYHSAIENLAITYDQLGDFDESKNYHEAVINHRRSFLGNQHPLFALSLHNYAISLKLKGDYKNAEILFRQSIEIKLEELHHNSVGLSETELLSYVNENHFIFDDYFSFIAEGIHQKYQFDNTTKINTYNLILQTKGLLFQNNSQLKNYILSSTDSTLKKKYETWLMTKTQLAHWYYLSKIHQRNYSFKLDSLKQEATQLERIISRKAGEFEAFDKEIVSFSGLRSTLQNEEVAVEIIRTSLYGTPYYMALVVGKNFDTPLLVEINHSFKSENQWISYYRNTIKFKLEDLYSFDRYVLPLFTTLQEKCPEVERVYFSSDGVYHFMNLDVIYNPYTEQYISQDVEIYLVSSTADRLKVDTTKIKNKKTAVLIGRPQYHLDSTLHKKKALAYHNQPFLRSSPHFGQKLKIEDLPGTELEVTAIQDILMTNKWSVTTFIKENALEEAIKQVDSPEILHISTHGFFSTDSLANAVDYMLSGGLLLAGVETYFNEEKNHQTDDGILTSLEASTLNLRNTKLVILSACETGLGVHMNGEGVYGLQRAFLAAGSKAIIMSLWKVDDKATQLLMTYFYETWCEGYYSIRESFAIAQKKLRKAYPDRYYWGGFIIIGNSDQN